MNNITKLLLFLLITSSVAYASIIAKVDSSVEFGEMATYSLTISGEDITRPNIQRLCDTEVISTSSQTSMQIINGNVSKSFTLNYKFIPQKSCKIAPVEVEIDGKIEKSNAVELSVVPPSDTKESDFVLTLSSDKKELFIGETFEMVLAFKQRSDAEAVDSKFTPPELKGFWVKEESQTQRYQEGKYTITKVVYKLAPQREGELKITKAQMQVASRGGRTDVWAGWIPTIKWKTYFSNELDLSVKPLPTGVNLIGDFTIEATVDKTEVKAGEAINVNVKVLGRGNLEDIKSFKPNLDDVAVFDEKITVEGARLTQKIAFVPQRDFIVPSFNLKFFDTKTKEIKVASTKEIPINVKNEKVKEELNIKREAVQNQEVASSINGTQSYDKLTLVLIFLAGFISAAILMITKPWSQFKNKKKSSTKEPKVLLVKLLPFKDDKEVKNIVDILEKNIYSKQKIEIDKKLLKELLKKYKID
ncbi:MAG: oxygen-tolerance protein [Sulfurimonas sp. RIFOXYD12_FULL_33_39]|uniref:BatD family protein n=1 Tax=unclassified Sulfurimonas TaxID=2623549 RepID=UPI0008D13819|nr:MULTISPECIES: BatD family protein [unclassified Sulfurimonas]OHE07076.1 MAG: oxygen-tolerance protein [Sulfurimonas sp. RIFCSPLOWO2_12_FULL_34_6]OHE10673.1 MAG: oxygen-tolerance protein [Sulfurimonas sp. RIFOXYD12_FULL_33_39]OHE13186.1 MAG: oxygen-tolerance protein [Sulfurimonas sp. RIFOXYD2_FULL_34_21]DAB27472.1 MAG TPA: oxygen-tolerance protein [Sulfurimonas sp. UBA10385]